ADAATAALAIHACPPVPGRPVLESDGLADLPAKALGWFTRLRESGRWHNDEAEEIRSLLERLAKVAPQRTRGAENPPFGLAHSEFHPTSIHIGTQGLKILDWARAYAGSGLLELVSWQGTIDPLDLDQVAQLIDAYVLAGGPKEAQAPRGGLPAHGWAAGWDKVWICEWFMEGTARWAESDMDHSLRQTVSLGVAGLGLAGPSDVT